MKTLIIVLASLSITLAGDGPFGIDFGTPISSFNAIKKGDIYILDSVPKPNPYFTLYLVRATVGQGIYWIKGLGRAESVEPTGESLRLKADEIAKQVSAVFGDQDKLYDFLRSESILTEPDEWMKGILKEERRYVYTWNNNLTPPFISSEVKSIFITPAALDSCRGAITIEYLGTNYKAAEDSKSISSSY